MFALKIFASHPVQYQVPLFRALSSAGVDIDVGFYHQGTAGRIARDKQFGIDIEWDIDLLSGYNHRFFWKQPATYSLAEQLRIAPKLLAWVMRERETPLLLTGWFSHLSWLVWLLRILMQAPVIMLCESTPLSFAATPKPPWRVALLRWLLRRTSAFLDIGQRNRDFLLQMDVSPKRMFSAPYSVDNTRFSTTASQYLPQRPQLCRQYGLDPHLPTFLFSGKLIPKKRPLQLLEAFLDASLNGKAQLIFVGEGSLRPTLETRAQAANATGVHFPGFFNQTKMPLAYVLGEILCLPSDPDETWGLVVNEAMACSRPVIVTDTIGCAPDLVSTENGWIIPLDCHEKLTEALMDAYNRYPEWKEMGHKSQATVAGHTFAAMAAGIQAALEKIKRDR